MPYCPLSERKPLYGVANTWRKQGKLADAILAYRQLLAYPIPMFDVYAYVGMGETFKDLNQLNAAITSYREALKRPNRRYPSFFDPELFSPHTLAYNGLGEALQQQGKLQEAIAAYKQAIALDPSFPLAQINLKKAEHLLKLRSILLSH